MLPLRENLMSHANRLLNNQADAEDIVQEAYFKLWFIRNELDTVDNRKALAYTIVKNLSLNLLKKRDRESGQLDETEASEESPYLLLEQDNETALLMQIINQLPKLQMRVFKMKHIDGLETEEIAELTGCSPEAVRMNLSRARKKVRDNYLIANK